MERVNNNTKFNLSAALLAGYIGEHIEYAFAIFLHEFTNTEVIEADLTGGIGAAFVTNVVSSLFGDKLNLISKSFLLVGLTYSIIYMYDVFIENKDVDLGNTSYRFVYDSIIIILIMYLYNKLLFVLKEKKVRTNDGLINKTIKNVIETLPISLYFGYRQFVRDINEPEDNKGIENQVLSNNEEI